LITAKACCASYFNPRPRAEGGVRHQPSACHQAYFNPRPRAEGGLDNRALCAVGGRISIHALVQRAASFPPLPLCQPLSISIHALVQRAAPPRRCPQIQPYFNPRPRAEGGAVAALGQQIEDISIHALVQRAACDYLARCASGNNFNPRPRAEGGGHGPCHRLWC